MPKCSFVHCIHILNQNYSQTLHTHNRYAFKAPLNCLWELFYFCQLYQLLYTYITDILFVSPVWKHRFQPLGLVCLCFSSVHLCSVSTCSPVTWWEKDRNINTCESSHLECKCKMCIMNLNCETDADWTSDVGQSLNRQPLWWKQGTKKEIILICHLPIISWHDWCYSDAVSCLLNLYKSWSENCTLWFYEGLWAGLILGPTNKYPG